MTDSTPNVTLKRKRYEPQEQELSVRIGGKIHHEKKEISRAVKRTKVFETQKTVKRLKDLRKKNEDTDALSLLEDELSQIKSTNHDEIANIAFRTKILKDHVLRSNADVLSSLTKELPTTVLQPLEGSAAKVHSRLLSSKILAKQVVDSVLSLKAVLDPSLKAKDEKIKSTPAKGAKSGVDDDAESLKEDAVERPRKKVKEPPALDQDDVGWESGDVSGDGEDMGEGEDGWESGSIAEHPVPAHGTHGSASDGSSSDNDSSSDSELTVKTIKPKSKATMASKPPSTTGKSKLSSTFLPSLSVGFVRGGSSDSDFDDEGAEGKVGDLPKKNRRGQRARRAIWEKKFGRNANHKKKEVDEEQERSIQAAYSQRKERTGTRPQSKGVQGLGRRQGDSSAPQPSRLSKQYQSIGPRSHEQPQPDSGWLATASRNSTKLADDKPLHPSWEAKKRLKEKESGSFVPSQGKKIKF